MAQAKDEKKKVERDPNKPFPKPKKKANLLLKLAVGGTLSVVLLWMGLYSTQIERGPWAWSGEDWGGFVTFSREQVEEARKNAETQLKKVDWDALMAKLPALEKKLEEKLAELRQRRGAPATEPADGAAPASMDGPAEIAPPSDLELGVKYLHEGTQHMKGARTNQAELKQARGLFEQAQGHLEKAYNEAEAKGDAQQQQEAEEYLMQCQTLLHDCSKMTVVH